MFNQVFNIPTIIQCISAGAAAERRPSNVHWITPHTIFVAFLINSIIIYKYHPNNYTMYSCWSCSGAEAEAIQRSLDYAPHYLCRILIKLLNNI